MRVIDLTGLQIGRLTVVSRAPKTSGQARWRCSCGCGKEVVVDGGALRKKNPTSSCGCLTSERAKQTMEGLRRGKREKYAQGLLGQKFERVTVISFAGHDNQGCSIWNCRCDCNTEFITRGSGLIYGQTKSCGCWRADSRKKEKGVCAKNHLLATYQAAAKRRGYKWQLSDAEFFSTVQQPCHYCGELPALRLGSKRYNGGFVCNGVDRKDNTQGYLFANVVPACKVCNFAKGTMSYEEYKTFLIRAGKFQLQLSTVE